MDDGSPDASGAMCDEYARQDSRIRVIHKENGGQASARNAGLDIMTGQYVGFVDSDDWIEADMYERLYKLLLSIEDCYILFCEYGNPEACAELKQWILEEAAKLNLENEGR